MKFLIRASRTTNIAVEKILAAMGLSMALIVALQVLCRYGLNHSLFWSEELARFLLVWLTFLGSTAAYYRGVHPGIDILTNRLSAKSQLCCRIAVYLLSLPLFLVMIYHGSAFAYFVRLQISPALGLPKWIVFSIIPASSVIFLLYCLTFLLSDFLKWLRHDD